MNYKKIHITLVLAALLATNGISKAMSEEEVKADALEHAEATLTAMPTEIQLLIVTNLTNAPTKEEAIKNILNLFKTDRQFAELSRDRASNGAIIKTLAEKFYKGDLMQAASDLNTPGAKLWLTDYVSDRKKAQEAKTPLFQAIYAKNNKTALNLIESNLSNTREPKLGRTPLMAAANANNMPVLEKLLQLKVNVDAKDNQGNSALYYAVRQGNIEAVKALVNAGADVNIQNSRKETPLLAASGKNPNIASFLIGKGANVKLVDNRGYTALHNAAVFKNVDLMRLLLSHGADVNAKDTKGQHTPLHFAAVNYEDESGLAEAVNLLVKAGADVNVICSDNDTPLGNAVFSNNLKAIQTLLQKGANPDGPAGDETPLISAIENVNIKILKALLGNGADPNKADAQGQLPLLEAIFLTDISDNDTQEIVKALAARGADVNAVDANGDSALVLAIKNNKPQTGQSLLGNGADPNKVDAQGQSPLVIAVADPRMSDNDTNEIVKALVARGADINAVDANRTSALTLTTTHSKPLTAQTLLKNGATDRRAAKAA